MSKYDLVIFCATVGNFLHVFIFIITYTEGIMTSLTLATFVNPASSATSFELHERDGRSVDVYKMALKNLTDAMDAKNLAGISSSSSITHNDKAPTDGGDFDITSSAANPDNLVEMPNQRTTPRMDSTSGKIESTFVTNTGPEPNYARYATSQEKYASTASSISAISDVYISGNK
jgi:hypothetical protein